MPDRISNYRQIRLIISPHNGSWHLAYWHLHFLTVRKGVPHDQVVNDGLIRMPSDVPTQDQFWSALGRLVEHGSDQRPLP